MAIPYPHLLEPLSVGKLVLKNRMTSAPSTPHFLQGSEPYPTDKWICHFANRARSGAAAVTINHLTAGHMALPGVPVTDNVPAHFNMVDMYDPGGQNGLCRLTDAIHNYGSLAVAYLPVPDMGMRPPEGEAPPPPPGSEPPPMPPGADITAATVTAAQMEDYINETVSHALVLQKLGFDIFSVHSAYRRCLHAQLLSPRLNHRSDEFGGSVENRSRFTLRLFSRLREALGEGVPLEIVMSVSEKDGWTLEDSIAFAELAQGSIDIMHLRGGEVDPQHPTGFTSTEEDQTPYLPEIAQVSHACRERGIHMLIGASAGFRDPDIAEKALADGDCDLICMARSWLCDPEYGQKIYEGRGEDTVPCIRCNKCHGVDSEGFLSFCSVNPLLGIEDRLGDIIKPVLRKKRVAVIGGGPAGMEAAIVCAKRGHEVTLFEKRDRLGGALCHADGVSFKWPLRQFRDYLIRQTETYVADIRLSCAAEKSVLSDYDAVLVSVGARDKRLDIPGAERAMTASAIYGHEPETGSRVVLIGGGEIAAETAIHLAERGCQVTVLVRGSRLAPKAAHSHYRSMLEDAWRRQPELHILYGVRCDRIGEHAVEYTDKDGKTAALPADCVILAVGTEGRRQEALSFFGVCAETVMIGDCRTAASLHQALRSAYVAAVQI